MEQITLIYLENNDADYRKSCNNENNIKIKSNQNNNSHFLFGTKNYFFLMQKNNSKAQYEIWVHIFFFNWKF